MTKKHLEPLANSDENTLDEVYGTLRSYGATADMFEYLADTVRALHDRYGELKLGQALGIDRDATVTHGETKEEMRCELIVFQMDYAKASEPEKQLGRVLVGFMLKDGKIDQLVKMS